MTTVMYGTELANKMRSDLKEEVKVLSQKNIQPGLAVIIVGDDYASKTYVRIKRNAAEKIGIYSKVVEFPDDINEETLLDKINEFNEDENIHGILVQLPLPPQIDERKILETIKPEKDVDGFHPINVGRLSNNQPGFIPCTPLGIEKMLGYYEVEVTGKHAVIVGRSNIVGKPIGQILLNNDATVTYCHSKTKNLKEITKQADLLIIAVGQANTITANMIKEGAVIVDVGNTYLESGKVVGDVAFDEVKEKASFITPVPKGVGPMTITMLLYNTVLSAKARITEDQ
ncbi:MULTISPECIES: bifunctional methylenetetrahydrofolate dehydrogenase/methenyltetrahydrofolate cyclohydrolase FolD [Allobacillus]|uniref:Bifunctional protein FolD n=1 Tax=Allobacillus salarius TaxID=1955272 RepID=A0A556PTF3_9BACI|nr:bifunctional methylenetetrahydrofolate dehydrogenase/methenyltetrahydrofolate cyclohydrolase FolD [Allobacillus salarius]TSJ67660.1 bifunctional methylenetetrahydrofolate dehydrogenase/methenyltetrahydrofolate cyclohydrolase FolD [Allobacillus salarius]